MGVPHPRHQTVGAAPTPAVPGWYKHPYQVEGCGKPALQKTKTLDGGRRAAVCVYIYIYAYPAPRSSASNRLVIRSDRYDPEIPRIVLRSQTVRYGEVRNAESETRAVGNASCLRRVDDRPAWYLPAYTRPTPRRAGRHPAAGPAPAARRGQRMTRTRLAGGKNGTHIYRSPPGPRTLSPRVSIPRSRR